MQLPMLQSYESHCQLVSLEMRAELYQMRVQELQIWDMHIVPIAHLLLMPGNMQYKGRRMPITYFCVIEGMRLERDSLERNH